MSTAVKVSGKISSFRDLEIWKLGKKIVVEIYKCSSRFPREETYGLIPQIRNTAVSIPSKIAEGFNCFDKKEYRERLSASLASCAELETLIELSYDLGYFKQKIKDALLEQMDHEQRMLRSLIKKLRSA